MYFETTYLRSWIDFQYCFFKLSYDGKLKTLLSQEKILLEKREPESDMNFTEVIIEYKIL